MVSGPALSCPSVVSGVRLDPAPVGPQHLAAGHQDVGQRVQVGHGPVRHLTSVYPKSVLRVRAVW